MRGLRAGPSAWGPWLLCWLAFLPVTLFAVISFWSTGVLFHWAAPGYLFLFPLLGVNAAILAPRPRLGHRHRRPAVPRFAGNRDRIALALDRLLRTKRRPRACRHWTGRRCVPALAARGLLEGRPIAGPDWADTGKISYALGGNPDVLCLNTDDREFGFGRTPADVVGQDILIVAPRLSPAQIQARYGAIFDSIETLAPVTLGFPGRSGETIPLFVGHHLRRWP